MQAVTVPIDVNATNRETPTVSGGSPIHAPDSMQAVTFPTDVDVTGRETLAVSGGPSILGNQQLANMEIGITERDSRMFLNEHQLAATQH